MRHSRYRSSSASRVVNIRANWGSRRASVKATRCCAVWHPLSANPSAQHTTSRAKRQGRDKRFIAVSERDEARADERVIVDFWAR